MLPRLLRVALLFVAIAAGTGSALAQQSEQYRFSWRLRGALAWIARIAFPTSGVGELKNVQKEGNLLDSQLLITARNASEGHYLYRSEIDQTAERTMTSYHGYAWGGKFRKERTRFDYANRIAHIREEEADEIENRQKALPGIAMRDVLTGIHYLRQNAEKIDAPLRTNIYSDGKMYPVVFKPGERSSYDFDGQKIPARTFTITTAPGSKKRWPGGIRVWLSDDARHIPLRIDIKRGMASLQLDLESIG